jgi:uncharacterized RDD family membrane protein YckC
MSTSATSQDPALPDPATAPELFEGVLLRRVVAWMIDVGLLAGIGTIIFLAGIVVGIFTFGVGALAALILIPVVILGYYAATLGSPMRATVGMAMMDIVLTPARGRPLDGWAILIHPIVFWITWWIAWPVSLVVALVTPRRETVQDLITGTLMLRRSPMARHWQSMRRAGA